MAQRGVRGCQGCQLRRKFKKKRQQQMVYASLAAIVYHIWNLVIMLYGRRFKVVMYPLFVIKNIQVDVCIHVKGKMNSRTVE